MSDPTPITIPIAPSSASSPALPPMLVSKSETAAALLSNRPTGASRDSFAAVFDRQAADRPSLGTRFEGAFLSPMVSQILPSEESSIWGGPGGKLWRGLFAQEVANEIARTGGVGIAELIDEHVLNQKAGAPSPGAKE